MATGQMWKRMFSRIISIGGLLSLLCLVGIYNGDANADDVLTVSRYGGVWGDTIDKHIIRPFEKQYGIKVVTEPSTSPVALSKLGQQKSAPVIDVAWMDGGFSEMALNRGLLDWIDPNKVTNIKGIIPQMAYKTKGGNIYAVTTGLYSIGIVYNTKEVKRKLSSWFDLWDKEFEGKVTVPGPGTSTCYPVLVTIAMLNGGGINDIMPGLKAIAKLKPAAFYDSAGTGQNLIQTGEAIIEALHSSVAWSLNDSGLPILYAVPKEGAAAGEMRVHIIKGTKHKDWAEKLVNYAVRQQAQEGMAEDLFVAPVSKNFRLSEKADQRMPWGPGGNISKLNMLDYEAMIAKQEEWKQMWNKVVLGQ